MSAEPRRSVLEISEPPPDPGAGLRCMFCGEEAVRFQDGGPPRVEPFFRCYGCGVRVQVTNVSGLSRGLQNEIWAVRFRKSPEWRRWREERV